MANNQYVNKVIFGNETLIDLSNDSINNSVLIEGYTAHSRSGAPIVGSLQYKSPIPNFDKGYLEIAFNYGVYSGTMNLTTISIPVPSSGTNSITIKVPNGTTTPSTSNESDWIPITFTVDSSGNSEITDDLIMASGVSF